MCTYGGRKIPSGGNSFNYFDSSFTVTASKHLQDQYIKDIPFLKPVKGKAEFSMPQTNVCRKDGQYQKGDEMGPVM